MAFTFFDRISQGLAKPSVPAGEYQRGHAYHCRCGGPVFFPNSICINCQSPLGFEPFSGKLLALDATDTSPPQWSVTDTEAGTTTLYKRCRNFDSTVGCNWLLAADDQLNDFCLSCRLNRTIPNLDEPSHQHYWREIENAKRRLIAQLVGLALPVRSKVTEDPAQGLAFDFLKSPPGGPRVLTGHDQGLITLNIEEADDAVREKMRTQMKEPYRTLLGHFRHEVGHYYWDRLIASSQWLQPFRQLFGDHQQDYAQALRQNYESGPPADWRSRFISAYASVHPWEDWAESWAHYLHLMDSLDTALGYGINVNQFEVEMTPYQKDDLYDPSHPDAETFLFLVNSWLIMVTVLNELSRSMGQPDFYPFVISAPVLKKLHFIHLVVRAQATAQ